MTTSTATREHTDDRYAARTRGRTKVGHLLLLRWPETDLRRGRPSLCGEVSRKWLRVDTMDNPPPPCTDCNERAGITPEPPRRIAPAAGAREPAGPPLNCPTTAADVLDQQLAHAGLPAGWRPRRTPSLPMSAPDGSLTYGLLAADADYVPRHHLERADERAYAYAVVAIDFPDWAPLTYCRNE